MKASCQIAHFLPFVVSPVLHGDGTTVENHQQQLDRGQHAQCTRVTLFEFKDRKVPMASLHFSKVLGKPCPVHNLPRFDVKCHGKHSAQFIVYIPCNIYIYIYIVRLYMYECLKDISIKHEMSFTDLQCYCKLSSLELPKEHI